ncbi:MAG: peptide chain release factor 2 [Acidobacteriota bacterium]
MKSETVYKYRDLEERVDKIRSYLDLEDKKKTLAELDAKIAGSGFWNNQTEAQQLLKKRSDIAEEIEGMERILKRLDEVKIFFELAQEGEEIEEELQSTLDEIEKTIEKQELNIMLMGEHDHNNSYLAIHPGAGGTESQDWAAMLMRMYLRWAERKGYSVKILDYLQGEEAGIKSMTCLVEGKGAYGYLKAEKGVHRLVRISPFDANARRHTSFASVDAYPEIDESITVEIEEKDLRVDTYRSSGAGGQHVNVTDSAVRITHLPTGIVVQCQNERSQHRNREVAMGILRSRLFELKMREMEEKRMAEEKKKKKIEWGSQIRSYVLHPYNLVKDHRTGLETGDVQRVLDGDLDLFIKSYLLSERK